MHLVSCDCSDIDNLERVVVVVYPFSQWRRKVWPVEISIVEYSLFQDVLWSIHPVYFVVWVTGGIFFLFSVWSLHLVWSGDPKICSLLWELFTCFLFKYVLPQFVFRGSVWTSSVWWYLCSICWAGMYCLIVTWSNSSSDQLPISSNRKSFHCWSIVSDPLCDDKYLTTRSWSQSGIVVLSILW